jgi:hypothetical protein
VNLHVYFLTEGENINTARGKLSLFHIRQEVDLKVNVVSAKYACTFISRHRKAGNKRDAKRANDALEVWQS